VVTTPGVSYSATCDAPSVNAPRCESCVVLVRGDTALTCNRALCPHRHRTIPLLYPYNMIVTQTTEQSTQAARHSLGNANKVQRCCMRVGCVQARCQVSSERAPLHVRTCAVYAGFSDNPWAWGQPARACTGAAPHWGVLRRPTFWPTSMLVSVDLPALGTPMTATCIGFKLG